MKEYPIIFSTEMIPKILDGIKTMTRRVITPQTSIVGEGKVDWSKFCWDGSQIYRDVCTHGHVEERKAPLPFVDGRANEYYPYEHQYLHVPYNWTEDMTIYRIYPRWEVGDRLWVRETWAGADWEDDLPPREMSHEAGLLNYKATPTELSDCFRGRWRPSIFMPHWASRIDRIITLLRVERLRDISPVDAKAEGGYSVDEFIKVFLKLNHLPEDANPWNWVIGW